MGVAPDDVLVASLHDAELVVAVAVDERCDGAVVVAGSDVTLRRPIHTFVPAVLEAVSEAREVGAGRGPRRPIALREARACAAHTAAGSVLLALAMRARPVVALAERRAGDCARRAAWRTAPVDRGGGALDLRLHGVAEHVVSADCHERDERDGQHVLHCARSGALTEARVLECSIARHARV